MVKSINRQTQETSTTAVVEEDRYAHFAPAVRFGHSLVTAEQFKNKPWADIEAEARRLWAKKHDRPWDEFKEVVYQAWREARAEMVDEAEQVDGSESFKAIFRRHYEDNYADSNYEFAQYAPAYYFGYDLAVDKRLYNKTWTDVEPQARRHWNRQGYAGTWDAFEEAAHFAWSKVREMI